MSSAIPLIYTLQSISGLSTLNSYINASSKLTNLFSSSNNFTFLAPTNDAFQQWISSSGNVTMDVVEATLSYHLLNGSYPTVTFTDQPRFPSTNLNNQSYENVTIYPPGQRVELIDSSEGPVVLSSNKTTSTITQKDTICLGGIIQVINTVLRIPTTLLALFSQANLSYFLAILNQANFLALNNAGLISFVNNVTTTPDVTFFCPNSAASLASFQNFSKSLTADELLNLFNYHIVYDFVGYSSVLTNGTTVKTAQGTDIIFTRDASDNIYVNQVQITSADYMAVNGVFHVLDGILDRNNVTIPPQIPRAATATSTPTPSHTSLSTGAIVAISVVIPVVVIALLAGLILWFLRRRKRHRAELPGASRPEKPRGELDGVMASKELMGDDANKELDTARPTRELDASTKPTELPSPPPPIELDATPHGSGYLDVRENTTPSTAGYVSPMTASNTPRAGHVTP